MDPGALEALGGSPLSPERGKNRDFPGVIRAITYPRESSSVGLDRASVGLSRPLEVAP